MVFFVVKSEICFEVRETGLQNGEQGILLKDLKIFGAIWDSSKKAIVKSEYKNLSN